MSHTPLSPGLTAYTLGHSNQPMDAFLDLLAKFQIEVVADVRSAPYGRYATEFNADVLRSVLRKKGFRYLFLGDVLGGRPSDPGVYDDEGFVHYDLVAQSPEFQAGVERLLEGLRTHRVALLCSEEDPTSCHRRLLIGRVLGARQVQVIHIRGDGTAQSEAELAAAEKRQKDKGQLTLFDMEESAEWKSTRSVSARRAPESSSKLSSEPASDD